MRSSFCSLLLVVLLTAPDQQRTRPHRAASSRHLSGTVVDSQGAVIPGANVKIKNNGTGEEVNTISGYRWRLQRRVTARGHLLGHRIAHGIQDGRSELRDVERGGARERESDAPGRRARGKRDRRGRQRAGHSRRRSPSISANLSSAQITSLPLTSRNALDSLTSLPGFNTSGTARNSTINGLPKSAINITLDGMSIQDNYLKTSDGYFARLTPTLDSVDEVTVTMAGNTADATGQGGVQVKFVTKIRLEQLDRNGPTSTCATTRSTRTPGSTTAIWRRTRRPARRRRRS